MTVSTFPALMRGLLRADASRPLVTFYDDASGERVELSVATYANWVDKTAGLVQDELGLGRGDTVLVDLPTHWLGAVWLGAAWNLGLCVTDDRRLADDVELVVCGPSRVAEYAAGRAEGRLVVAISLRPLGGRFVDPLPSGVVDYGAVVLAQPDSFAAEDPPAAEDAAWRQGAETLSQRDLLTAAAERPLVARAGRLLTDVNPAQRSGLATLLSPVLREGGVIWVANPADVAWQPRYDEERATDALRAQPTRS
jgi:uncharacterized protein (TIGR03089 family)